ncbi:MAG TPA: single-stranded DNA-binding protein [Candidatus Limnocylindrales bacterium]|nr:single-stranded DNA-binding protein [Candidatus Limnocylindrales bacterium]
MSLNKAMIIGNLGRDPEMRYTPSGQAVTQFTVAVNRNYRDQQGEWQEETEWFRVVAWAQLAERTAEYLRKGRKVYVEGRLQTRSWEDQNGQKRYTTELIANTVTPLDPRPRDEGDPGPGFARGGAGAGAGGGGFGDRAEGASRGGAPAGAPASKSGDDGGPAYDDASDLDDLPF